MLYLGNFKMNEVTDEYIEKVTSKKFEKGTVGLAFPYIYIDRYAAKLKESNIMVGAENVYYEENGAYTGEISASMLNGLGCDFVLIGHSERRGLMGETNDMVHKKVLAALKHKLTPVICVGETKKEKDEGKTIRVIKHQVKAALKDLYANEISGIVIAYEPVWAIGTGLIPTVSDIATVVMIIKSTVAKIFNGENVKVLYGGSCNDKNVGTLETVPNLDGFLIGGACMDADKFHTIIGHHS